jgi:hypothetical protein
MQISKATVDREVKFVKSWLYGRIHVDQNVNPGDA